MVVRVLVLEALEDGVVAGHGVDLALLQGDEAVGAGVDREGLDLGEVGQPGQGRRSLGGAHRLAVSDRRSR